MEVILCENYPSLGYVGDRIEVKSGFARNYLIPRGIATELQSRNARLLKHKLSIIEARKAKSKKEAEEYAQKLSEVHLKFELRIGEHGKSFGSISTRDIHEALKNAGFEFEKRQIKLAEPIKAGGQYRISIQLHSDVVATVPATVEAVVVSVKKDDAEEDSKKRSDKRGRKPRAEQTEDAAQEAEGAEISDSSEA